MLDRLEQSVARQAGGGLAQQLSAVELQIAALSQQVTELHAASPEAARQVPRAQERLQVDEAAAGGGATPARAPGPAAAKAAKAAKAPKASKPAKPPARKS